MTYIPMGDDPETDRQALAELLGIHVLDPYPQPAGPEPLPQNSIYIAGPMRGYAKFNFPAFYEAEAYLKSKGWLTVGNPARMDDEGPTGPDEFEVMPGNGGIRLAMARDLEWIATKATALYMLRGWEKSAGATAEWTLAKTLGLDIFYQESI